MVTHSSILARRIPWTEEPGGLQSMGSKELGMAGVIKHSTYRGLAVCHLTGKGHFNLYTVLESKGHCPCFTDKETEITRS